MPQALELTDDEIRIIAGLVLGEQLKDHGFAGVEVRSGRDQDGEPAVFVTALVSAETPTLPGRQFSDLHGALHDALSSKGERRFPYFELRDPNDTPVGDSGFAPE